MKNFNSWNRMKQQIESARVAPQFCARDIWWCQIGANIGFEEDGKNEPFERPVLVLKKFNKYMFFGLPLTSVVKNNKYHCQINSHKQNSYVILSQGRTLSSKRLTRKMFHISQKRLSQIWELHKEVLKENRSPQN